MQRQATLAEKVSGVILIVLAISGLYFGLLAIFDGYVWAGRRSGHRAYFSASPIEYLLYTGLFLVSSAVFSRIGWAVMNGRHHTQTIKTITLPSWFKLDARVLHPTYGAGAIVRINGRKYVTIAFDHYSQKTLKIEVALTLLKPIAVETNKPTL